MVGELDGMITVAAVIASDQTGNSIIIIIPIYIILVLLSTRRGNSLEKCKKKTRDYPVIFSTILYYVLLSTCCYILSLCPFVAVTFFFPYSIPFICDILSPPLVKIILLSYL